MVVYKRKKKSRQRGGWTHGWGSKKKHRGAGNRGGRGMAGTGKRADTRKPSIWKERYFGKKGFVKKGAVKEVRPLNIVYLEENFNRLLKDKIISKEGDAYVVDISRLDHNKLLGNGKVTRKYKIKTEYASKSIVEEIKKMGGEVILDKKVE